MKYMITLLCITFLVSCGEATIPKEETQSAAAVPIQNTIEVTNVVEATQEIEQKLSTDVKDIETVYVTLDSENTETTSDAIQVSGQKITIKKSGNYEFTGTLSNGQIVVESDDEKDVQIILNNVDITNSNDSAIYVSEAPQVIITLAENSQNTLSDGSEYTDKDSEANAALFSHDDLVISGKGILEVKGNYKDGITSKDKLYIETATIIVTAVDDGMRGKDYLEINSGNITITSEGDALMSDDSEKGEIVINGGNIEITSGDDAIAATHSVEINGGNINVSESYEAIESESITINGGETYLTSSDDGVNITSSENQTSSNSLRGGEALDISLKINGGKLTLDANGDGLDSNGDIIMTGGEVIVYGPTQDNNGALDFDGEFDISGGSLLAVGSSGMAEAPDADSSQNSLLIGLETAYQAGSIIVIKNDTGKEIFSINSLKSFQSVVASSSEIVVGGDYTLEINGEVVESFSTTGTVTTIGEVGRGGGRGFGR